MSDDGAEQDALWDVDQVAQYLNLPVSRIYKMTARKAEIRMPHIRIGGQLRFRKADVDAWLLTLSVGLRHGHSTKAKAG